MKSHERLFSDGHVIVSRLGRCIVQYKRNISSEKKYITLCRSCNASLLLCEAVWTIKN